MFRKKVSKLVSSAILLESVSVLGLQAQVGVTGDYIKPFDSKLLLRGLDSTESTEVLKKSGFSSILVKLFCGVALSAVLVGVTYCILCNVEKKLTVKKYDALIKKSGEEINELNKMKWEIPNRNYDSEIKTCETEILKLKEEKEKLEKEVDFLEKNKNVCNFLKEINNEINYLGSAHYYLNKQMQIQICKSEAEKDRKKLEEVCKKINNLGLKVDVKDFLYTEENASNLYSAACVGVEIDIKNTLKNQKIKIVYKGNKKTRKIEEIDVDAMKFADDELKTDIQEKVLKYKQYVKAKELCKGTMSVVNRIKNNESGIKNDEMLIAEQAKVRISSDDYKKRIAELLEKVRGVESSMPQGDEALEGAYSELKENLQKILESNKDMGTIENGIDLKKEFVNGGHLTAIERQMLRFSGENVNKLKEKINSITENIGTQEFFIKSYEASKEAAKQLKKNNAEIMDKVSEKKKELENLIKEKNNIEKTAWYKLHRLGDYYSNVPSLESLEN